jgi:uncharacterized membrane protein
MTQHEHQRLLERLKELERDSERFQRELHELRRELAREKGYDRSQLDTPDAAKPEAQAADTRSSRELPVVRSWRQVDLEFWIGGRGLLLVGVAALVFAVAFFVKEAIERGWIGPTIRVLAGGGIGIAAAIAGDRIRALGYRTYGLWLSAGGFSAVYLSVWAAAALYALVPVSVGFVLMVVVVGVAAAVGLLRQSESFVALAAFGGYLAPILLQVGTPSNLFGLGYLALLTGAALAVAYRAGWVYLATVAVLGGSFLALANRGDPHLHGVYIVALVAASLVVARRRYWPGVSLLAMLLGWVVFWIGSVDWQISGITFASYALAIWLADLLASLGVTDWVGDGKDAADEVAFRRETKPLARELCGLAVTVLPPWFFFASAMAGIFDSSFSDRAQEIGLVLAAILGAIYLVQAVAGAPGRGAGSRFWRAALGFTFLLTAPSVLWEDVALTRAWLVEGIAFTTAGVALKRAQTRAAGLAAFALAVLTYWGSVYLRPGADAAFISGWGLTGLVAVSGLALWAMALERVEEPASWEKAIRPLMFLVAGVLFLAWGTGEIQRFFDLKGDQERWTLARDLSISAFWMLYAAALLALGFWRQLAPVRWAGLAMALIAAAKVFIYDLSNLDRLYRIFSFVLLAAVLLALSFWYQKTRGKDVSESS